MRTVITATRLWNGSSIINDPVILVDDGQIVSISNRASAEAAAADNAHVHHYPGATLAPAFLDVHTHGAAGHDSMEGTPDALRAIGAFLARHGTANYLPTTVTASVDATLRAVEGIAKIIENPALIGAGSKTGQAVALPIGIHLEGPFLSHERRGVHPPELLLAPDIRLFDRFFEAAQGHVRLMTLAPELPGAVDLAAHATARGVRISMGHSNATAAETRECIAAGAVSATHTFNAMRPLDHQELGILGTVLTDDSLYSELICDGIHNKPEIVKLWWRAKGPERALLITDAMTATGMPDGEYLLGGFPVQVANGKATARGVLAGSLLTLDRALANFVEFAGASVDQALRLMTSNPAAMTGLGDRAGHLAVGQPAHLVAVDSAGKLLAAIHYGEPVAA